MKYVILVFNMVLVGFSLLFISCESQEKKQLPQASLKVENSMPNELNSSKKIEDEKDLLNRLGFEFKDEKIIIDINKTSNFFTQIEAQMKHKAEEIESKIANAEINISRDMGIKIEGDQVGIDLNRTKNMLQQINILMKDILLDVNGSKH